jgi:alpha-beta hydrolase superfamily lysophospholipase
MVSTIYGRVEALDRIYDPPTGTPYPPENFLVQSKDNIALMGWKFPVDSLFAWVIVLPDPHRNRSGTMHLVRWLTRQGYGVLAMDLRARGESGGRHIAGGAVEAQDLIATVNQLRKQIGEQIPIVGYGVSSGAVASLAAAAQSDALDAVVADSPYLKATTWMKVEAQRLGWIEIPGLYQAVNLWTPIITGHVKSGSYLDLEQMVSSIRVPVLLISGNSDPYFNREDLEQLRSELQAPTTIETFAEGYSNSTYTMNREKYQDILADFLNSIISQEKAEADTLQ